MAVLDEDGDIARQIHAHPTRDKPARIDGVAPGAIRIRVWDQGSELLFRELTVDAGGQTVKVDLPDGAWLTVANPPHTDGPMGLVVRRIEDGLTVGMRSFGKQGFYRSPSRLPPGRYRAEVVQYGGRVPGTRRLLPSKVIRRKEFEVRPGKDVAIGWEGTKVAR